MSKSTIIETEGSTSSFMKIKKEGRRIKRGVGEKETDNKIFLVSLLYFKKYCINFITTNISLFSIIILLKIQSWPNIAITFKLCETAFIVNNNKVNSIMGSLHRDSVFKEVLKNLAHFVFKVKFFI